MLEILFSESAAGSLKSAQHYGEGVFKGTAVTVILSDKESTTPERLEAVRKEAEEQERKEWEKTVPLGGNPDDIFCFDLSWDMGDITEDGIGEKRLAVLNALYSVYDEDTQKGAKIQYDEAKSAFATVVNRVKKGEDVRIWYSDLPAERCGMLWFMAEMRNIDGYSGRVYTVKLPKYMFDEQTNTITELHGWGEISPSQWSKFIGFTQDKTKEYWGYAQQWWNLKRENSSLRAVLNGRVRSVSEDIYDKYIWDEIDMEEEEFIQASVIGRVLGNYLGIGDAFVALRMEKFIEGEILQVVPKTSRGPAVYHRKLRKNY